LHGNAPDRSEVALLLIDVINDLEWPGGEKLVKSAKGLTSELLSIKDRARRASVPCIYANDNFGRWRSDFAAQVEHCLQDGARGQLLARTLRPLPDDYFVLKPKHSAFYQTCLELLLQHLGVRTLLIGGIATDNCVLFSATDAFLRGYSLIVLSDGCAAMDAAAHRSALAQMSRLLHARIARCRDVEFGRRVPGTNLRRKKTARRA
jgi:nicotinamidase-related amidase